MEKFDLYMEKFDLYVEQGISLKTIPAQIGRDNRHWEKEGLLSGSFCFLKYNRNNADLSVREISV